MEDLDQYLESELASINDMFQEFETKDKQYERRIQTEKEELKVMEVKAQEVSECVRAGEGQRGRVGCMCVRRE